MDKFILFFICMLVSLQNSYEVSSTTKKDKIFEEKDILKADCDVLSKAIAKEIKYYTSEYFLEKQTLINEFDVTEAYYNLTTKINEIAQTEISPNSIAVLCTSNAKVKSRGARNVRQSEVSSCAQMVQLTGDMNEFYLNWAYDRLWKLRSEIDTDTNNCIIDNIDPTKPPEITEVMIQCVREVIKLDRSKFELVDTEFNENAPVLRSKANNALSYMKKCLNQLNDFEETADEIIDELEECAKKNSATNNYSKNIIFFCLGLFGLLRMI